MYLLPLKHPEERFPAADCWQPYVISADADGKQCDFYSQVSELDSAYAEDFLAWLVQFQKLCSASPKRPLETIIPDRRRLHDVGEITIQHPDGTTHNEKVWQCTHDRIRVLWCYAGNGRILIVGNLLLKKTKKTKKAHLQPVETVMQQYVDAQHAKTLKIIAGDKA